MKRGGLYCQKCGMKRKSRNCPHCNYDAVLIRLNYQGNTYRLYRDKRGSAYTFQQGVSDLLIINKEIQDKIFDPKDWLPEEVEARKFNNAFDTWCDVTKHRISPSTVKLRKVYYANYFQYFNNMDVTEIRLKHLQKFYDQLPETLSAKYRKNIIDCLKVFMRWLLRWGDIKQLPVFPEVQTPDSIPRTAISYEEQLTALANIPGIHRDFIEFLMETGLRPGEGCALKIGDIDPRNKTMLVQRTYSANTLRETTKGRHKMRVPLSDRAYELIKNAVGNDITQERFIFINPVTSGGYVPETLRKIWKSYSQCNVDLYSATRHSFCTQLVELGMSEIEAQGVMRHKDARSTRAYFHPTQERQRGFLNQRGKVIPMRKVTDESYR